MHVGRLLVIAALVSLVGCTFRVSGIDVVLDAEPLHTDLATARMDAGDAAAGDAMVLACDPNGGDNHCSADQKSLLTCATDGSGFNTTVCAFGCGTQGGTAHCLALEPSGVVTAADSSGGTAQPTITADVVFNTDDGSISGGLTRAAGAGTQSGIFYRQASQQGTSVKVGIFGFATLDIAQGAVVRAQGRSALAIVASKSISVEGSIDLEGECATGVAAASASSGGTAMNPNAGGSGGGMGGATMMTKSSGGGGGGYGDIGGRGGASNLVGGNGGTLFGDLTVEPLVLVGGSGGGAGGGPMAAAGGAGGGAIQLAVNGDFTLSGVIRAGGCGGHAGMMMGSGAGGGAGGAILIEAANVVFDNGSVVAANGGGGGGTAPGADGQDGQASAMPAAGGAAAAGGAGAGASGGARGATAGQDALAVGNHPAGGGGGGVGRIAIKTLDGTYKDQGATLSPDVSDFNSVGKRAAVVTRASFQ